MTVTSGHELPHLSYAASRLGAALARPRVITIVCIVALAGAGWLYLGLQAASMFDVICRPLSDDGQIGAGKIAIVGAMWGAMALAMMLPTAAPMILTYAEIADTAAGKGAPVVSSFIIAAGYAVVWIGFAALATVAQLVLMRAPLDATLIAAGGPISAAMFIGAGVYQFSSVKHACLTQCQHPFPFFFANWKTTPLGVLGLGLRQGLYCVGCCWAMMLLTFTLGAMNIFWMTVLGIVMAVEKIGAGRRFSHVIGCILIAVGAAFMLNAV
jgi:predicted metal-binding membrane protein